MLHKIKKSITSTLFELGKFWEELLKMGLAVEDIFLS